MKIVKTATAKLAELKSNLFVRQALDQDHVLYLAGLYEGGVKFDPIDVNEDLCVADGRHRREMYEFLNVSEISVRIIRFDSEAEMIAYAFKANTGGSKPPTPADIDHTIELLLERGGNQKTIADWLGLPIKMVRKYVDDVRSRLARAKLMRAVDAVLNGGLSVAKAAEQYEVDLDKLKEHLSGKKKKPPHGINAIHQKLTYNYKSISSQNAALFRKLITQYDDGDVTKNQATEIIGHLEGLQRKSARALAEWKARLEAKFSNGEGKAENAA